MALACLRPELPPPTSFTVTALPCTAKLDQNESPVDLPAELKRSLLDDLAGRAWNRYPQPAHYVAAKAAFGRAVGIEPDRLCLTMGGDQTILAAFHVGGGPGRRARWFEPTYPYVAHAARLTHTEGGGVALGAEVDARIDVAAIEAAPRPQLVALVSPNNPTGGCVAREVVEAALADERRLVFVDEAYADFAGTSLAGDSARHANLMIGRSLSKALLAGMRLGYVIAHPEVIRVLEQLFTAPYHLSAMHLVLAARYGEIAPYVRDAVAQVVAERARVFEALSALDGVAPRPSEASFVLFAVDGGPARAQAVHGALATAGVRVRDVGGLPGLASYLRVTIGTAPENDAFLAALRNALAQ